MTKPDRPLILAPEEGPAAEVINPAGQARICLVCEHASAFIPEALGGLGLAPQDRYSHAAWDPGALAVARHLAAALDAPLVASRVSRLVHDCNRPARSPEAMPARTELVEIPGNRDLDAASRAARAEAVYRPFSETLAKVLAGFDSPPALVTIHSFAPVWFGTPRNVELGLLHDSDDRLARRMMHHAPEALRTELNAPYSAQDGVTHTLARHAIPMGCENAMIELRNDLVADAEAQARIAAVLAEMLTASLASREGEAA